MRTCGLVCRSVVLPNGPIRLNIDRGSSDMLHIHPSGHRIAGCCLCKAKLSHQGTMQIQISHSNCCTHVHCQVRTKFDADRQFESEIRYNYSIYSVQLVGMNAMYSTLILLVSRFVYLCARIGISGWSVKTSLSKQEKEVRHESKLERPIRV